MTDTVAKIGEFLSQQEQTATAVAQRFGMHLHDDSRESKRSI